MDKSAKLRTLNSLEQLRGRNEGIALFFNGCEPGSPPAGDIPAGTLVIYFAQSATLTFPDRLKGRKLERKEQELKRKEQELEESKRKQEELEKEVKRLKTLEPKDAQ